MEYKTVPNEWGKNTNYMLNTKKKTLYRNVFQFVILNAFSHL